MSQPVWITPAGSLGSIPEGIFYQNTMLVVADPLPNSPVCTATSSATNRITCTSTQGLYHNLNVMFLGNTFGGIDADTRYFVLEVVSDTEFTITTTEFSSTPVSLTTATGIMTAEFRQHVYYSLIAGALPPGIQLADNGVITGIPKALASLQGVPFDVNRDVTSKFTIRAYTETATGAVDRIRDRTFNLTIVNTNAPVFTSPNNLDICNAGTFTIGRTYTIAELGSTNWTAIGCNAIPAMGVSFIATGTGAGTGVATTTYYDGDRVDIQLGITNVGPNAAAVVTVIGGQLPGGVTVSDTGLISGYIEPATNVAQLPGYDLTAEDVYPYDFVSSAVNKSYQFTCKVTDGQNTDIRTFSFFVYNRLNLNASTDIITADNGVGATVDAILQYPYWITADEGLERKPFIVNSLPSYLGTVRSDNYYAHQFIANDYDTPDLKYAISVNVGSGLPPGLTLDVNSGWYYGYIPDQGVTEVTYSFNIVTYQADFVGTPIVCTATTFSTNIITCDSTLQINPGQPIVFTGTSFGGITASPTQVYYVLTVESDTEFTITNNLGTTSAVTLTNATGTMSANLIVASEPYPFTLTINGAINAEVVWLTPSDLGYIENGSTSMLVIEAVNTGGRALKYRLKPGAGPAQLPYPYVPGQYNLLPQGLQLLESGEISGRVTFNTFAIDLGTTTFDATYEVTRNVDSKPTTFDSIFTFTVNAYAEDAAQLLYKVSSVNVLDGGTGFSSTPGSTPVLTFNSPVGATAIQAQVGDVTVTSGAITAVSIENGGNGYTAPATLTVTEGYGGSGAVFQPVMKLTGSRDVVSVDKTFTVQVQRAYNKPYQNLLIEAMPPQDNRVTIQELLDNEQIFVPDYIYRRNDPYFGKARRVVYQHAFGLAPDTLDAYVSSLYENHYWKNLVLGEIDTAQAVDPDTGQVVYEVVYSKIVDDLVNAAGASVSKIVNLPYDIIDPTDGSTQIAQVYPNSLVNMRDQVIDVVGQISTKLPLWMTSKQANGRVLGFTPAWVMCYTKPGRSAQIAYYISTQFTGSLNSVDFKVDRYVLDHTLSRHWDTTTQNWTPKPSLTTFDRYGSGGLPFIGYVDFATRLAYADINQQPLSYISSLGGLDGVVTNINGKTLIFVKQQYYTNYDTPDAAWQNYLTLYDAGLYDQGSATDPLAPPPQNNNYPVQTFDNSYTIPGGYTVDCYNTYAANNYIKAANTVDMQVNDPVWFTGTTFGGITTTGANGLTEIYYVTDIANSTCSATATVTNWITCASTAYISVNDVVWFTGTTFGGIDALDTSNNIQEYYVVAVSGSQFKVSLTPGGSPVTLSTATGSMNVNTRYFSVRDTTTPITAGSFVVGQTYTILSVGTTNFVAIGAASNTVGISFVATGAGLGTGTAWLNTDLTTASGDMIVHYGNTRMAIFTITVDPVTTIVTLTPSQLTAQTQYVQVLRGRRYTGSQLYFPPSPAEGYTLINWLPVPESRSNETTFDGASMAFEQPVDMYDPTDRDDKYLVFPKANILV